MRPQDARPNDAPAMAGEAGVPNTPPRLAADVTPIVSLRCAVAGCHDPVKREHNMNLATAATIYESWVGKTTADHCRSNMIFPRVMPGRPEMSFVITVMEGVGRCADLPRMPPAPRPAVPPADIKIIRDWIAAGALNN
jgi:hypothetical protein